MKAALLSLALFGTGLTTAISAQLPKLSVEALCNARSAGDKTMRLPESQSVADCVRDETDARQKLGSVWEATSPAIRSRCESEIFSLDTRSYLDLYMCIQIAEDTKAILATMSKGASKNRNAR